VILVFVILTILASFLVLIFEQDSNPQEYQSFWDSIWWAFVTVFTVGYGDIKPVTFGGRMVAIVVMFAGITLLSLITATISSIFVAKRIREDQGLESIKYEHHIILCGWNRNAEAVVETILSFSEHHSLRLVLINDLPEEEINSILDRFRKHNVKFIRGDYTQHAPLERANIDEADAVVLLPNLSRLQPQEADDRTLLATLNIKSSHAKLKVIAFLMNRENEIHLKRAKADQIFISDQFINYFIASHVVEPGLTNVFADLLTPEGRNSIETAAIPQRFRGKTYSELSQHFKEQHKYLLLGLLSEVETIGISAFLSSDTSQLDAFIEKKLKQSGHTLGEENKILVNLNPDDDYVIQENEKAIVLK